MKNTTNATATARRDEILAMDCNELQGNQERLYNERERMARLMKMTGISRTTPRYDLVLNDWSLDELLKVSWEFMPDSDEESERVTHEEALEVAQNVVHYERYLEAYYDDAMDTIELMVSGGFTSGGMETRLHRYDHCQEMLCYCYARLSKRLGLW